MAGLQRSAVSFRRQGSSGLIWEDRFLSGELNQVILNGKEDGGNDNKSHQHRIEGRQIKLDAVERSRSIGGGGGRGFRTGKVSPAIEPPSPKVSACGFCGAFGKRDRSRGRPMSGKPRSTTNN